MDKMVIANDEFFAEVERMLSAGRRVTIPVKGWSMLPFIRGGKDLVELDRSEVYAPGDIVLFHLGPSEGGRWVMHRILRTEDRGGREWAVIRGDGVVKNTEEVPLDSIVAKAVKILRSGTREVDPYTPSMMRKVRFWGALRPIRRYLLFVYRRLPWNYKWIRQED